MAHLLQVDGLKTHFMTKAGPVKAVDGVSFSLNQGQTLAIVGESGSGKSVTMLSLLGLLAPGKGPLRQGRASYADQDLLAMPAKQLRSLRGREIGMIFQDPMTALNPYLTIGSQLAEVLTAHGLCGRKEAWARAAQALTDVGLPDAAKQLKAYPHELSGGMRQRAMIAMAVIARPKLLIADEPTTALDVTVQAQILALLAQLQQAHGMGLIVITHDLGVVAGLADQILVMYAGKAVEQGSAHAVLQTPQHPYTQGLLRSVPRLSGTLERLEPIPGLPPDPLHLPLGCSFAPRCASATAACSSPAPLPLRRHSSSSHNSSSHNSSSHNSSSHTSSCYLEAR